MKQPLRKSAKANAKPQPKKKLLRKTQMRKIPIQKRHLTKALQKQLTQLTSV